MQASRPKESNHSYLNYVSWHFNLLLGSPDPLLRTLRLGDVWTSADKHSLDRPPFSSIQSCRSEGKKGVSNLLPATKSS